MIESLIAIALLHWVVLLIPGVNFVLIGQLAASSKRGVAYAAVAGITTVTFLWASLAVLGIGLLFNSLPPLRMAFQLAGGAYLCFLAYNIWGADKQATHEKQTTHGAQTPSSKSAHDTTTAPTASCVDMTQAAAYRIGFTTNVLNPKTALFFSSVFASALPANPSARLLVLAVCLVYLNALVWHVLLVWIFSNPNIQTAYQRYRVQMNRFSATVVGVLGVKLVISTLLELIAVAH